MDRFGFGCLVCVVFLCFWLRCVGMGGWYPLGQLTEHDGYLYQHQASIVSETGFLPASDLQRWVPLGRDTTQSLNLYPMVLGHLHRLLRVVFPSVSVYQIVFFAPVVCFSLSVFVCCLFLTRTHGFLFSLLVGLLLTTLPGTIERSTAGFGDRDAFCFLIGVSAVVSYLWSVSCEVYRRRTGERLLGAWQPTTDISVATALSPLARPKRLLWTLVSGVLVFLGGLSWEGFGVFVSLVLCVEIYRFLTTAREEGLFFFVLWVLCFVPSLYLASGAYRSGVGWSTHLFSFLLVPPVVVLFLRGLRYWLLEKSPVREALLARGRWVSVCLIFFSVSLALCYVVSIQSSFGATTVVFGSGRLMENITELFAPGFGYWPYRYGSVFLTGSLGLSLLPLFRWGRLGRHLSVSVFCFCVLVFFRRPVAGVFGAAMADALFSLAVIGVGSAVIHLSWKLWARSRKPCAAPEAGVDRIHRGILDPLSVDALTCVAMLFWCIFWFALARSAKRYDFFIGVGLAYFTAVLIQEVATGLLRVVSDPRWTTAVVHQGLKRYGITPVSVSVVFFLGVCLWGPMVGGHVFRSVASAKESRRAVPGVGGLSDAYAWMKTNLPADAVVAAEWSYGTQLNVLGGVRTIVGPDHYLPYWIELYHRHVQHASNEREMIAFLLTHEATHLMVTSEKQPEGTLLRSGELSGVFVPVYPQENFETSPVKVYGLRYPAGLEKHPEYLKTGR